MTFGRPSDEREPVRQLVQVPVVPPREMLDRQAATDLDRRDEAVGDPVLADMGNKRVTLL